MIEALFRRSRYEKQRVMTDTSASLGEWRGHPIRVARGIERLGAHLLAEPGAMEHRGDTAGGGTAWVLHA